MKLSFYTPIAYDYKYAFASIISYYEIADEIILAIDQNRISWSKQKYEFDEKAFNDRINEIDKDKKIKIIAGNFHGYLKPMDNDTGERNFVSVACKPGNYIVGIDSDEILLNANAFKNWMDISNPRADIKCKLFTVYKSFKDVLLNIQPDEMTVIGTPLAGCYIKCRNTKNIVINCPLEILHFSWARNETELLQKLTNWGHSGDFNVKKYYQIWQSVNLNNYRIMKSLHPLGMKLNWTGLSLMNLSQYKISEQLLKEINGF